VNDDEAFSERALKLRATDRLCNLQFVIRSVVCYCLSYRYQFS